MTFFVGHSLYIAKFILTFLIWDKVFKGQSLYETKFMLDKVHNVTKCIPGQSL
jgi:hypothetical protein